MILEKDVKAWLDAKEKLKRFKKLEKDLRQELCDDILAGQISGVSHKSIVISGEQWDLAATGKINYTIDKPALKSIWGDLTSEEKAVVKFDPKIVVSKYKKLSGSVNRLISVTTAKPGLPSLTIKLI